MKRAQIVKMTARTLAVTRSNKAAVPRVQVKHLERLVELQKKREKVAPAAPPVSRRHYA